MQHPVYDLPRISKQCEVRRIPLLRASVNRLSEERVKAPFWIFCTVTGCVRSVGRSSWKTIERLFNPLAGVSVRAILRGLLPPCLLQPCFVRLVRRFALFPARHQRGACPYLLLDDRPRDLVFPPRTFDLPEVLTHSLCGRRTAALASSSSSWSLPWLSASLLSFSATSARLSACKMRPSASSARLSASLVLLSAFWARLWAALALFSASSVLFLASAVCLSASLLLLLAS